DPFDKGCLPGLKFENGKCACVTDKKDGVCPVSASGCVLKDQDCAAGACQLLTAKWEVDKIQSEKQVKMFVAANNQCTGKTVTFEVMEDDPIGDSRAKVQPASVPIFNGAAVSTWIAEYMDDGPLQGDPEYYFIARVESAQLTSGLLEVGRGSTAVCGNNQEDSGESCATCNKDAGCSKEKVCCGSGGTATCATSCSDPFDKGCLPGLKFENGKCVCVVGTEDGVCSVFRSGCFLKDPDCDDKDGVNPENDNCPLLKNSDQSDLDRDGTSQCEFEIAGLGEFGITSTRDAFCGGDICDLDADNDGVCDRPSSTPSSFKAADRDGLVGGKLCFGEDKCIAETQGQLVNDEPGPQQGCTDQDVTCMVQWDCSNILWGPCVEGIQARDIGDCSLAGINTGRCRCDKVPHLDPACRSNAGYRPAIQEACVLGSEATAEDFPFFSWVNVLVTIVLIAGFYLRKRRYL
ncbi:MAG: hypothetical protein AABX86_00495, partial [Nanoarchaeota archaeon]